ncbi:hypothetical protein FJ936_30080 [Mesorhizobium sp. B2-4-13]|uniref:hypothetical protein n=1 Tax=Mesorhizobium sp. B2-4-13 TaxID=2589936 RepID=UPI001154EE60|nr:hypothetical protein [Mesorhizobium sp. B2-4-13]TPK79030.1 hypothetical protein FJ936_30080 [Mesorhizobium sp. B2-4-13]
MSKDEREIIRQRLVSTKASLAEARADMGRGLEKIYDNPQRAFDGIADFYKSKGEGALMKKLEQDPAYFGAKNGHLGSSSFLTWGAGDKRAVAADVAKGLPGKVKGVVDLEQKVENLRKALHGEEMDFTPGGGRDKGGPNR